jgi:hypothetical protein
MFNFCLSAHYSCPTLATEFETSSKQECEAMDAFLFDFLLRCQA